MENAVVNGVTYEPRQIIAGTEMGLLPKGIKVKKGQGVLLSGTVLGVVTASGLCVTVDSSASDGSQVPVYVLTDTTDTNKAEDVVTTGYMSGVFKADKLVFGGSDTLAIHEKALRELGIYTK